MKKSTAILGCVSLVVLVGVILLSGSGVYLSQQPNFNRFLPASSSSVQVRIASPFTGRSFPADSYIPIFARAEGEMPVQAIELWINGKLFETQAAPAKGMKSLTIRWNWQPGSEGSYALVARAVDSSQNASISEVVTIIVKPAAGYIQGITTQEGDSLVSLANQYGTTPEKILNANPQLGGGSQGQSNPQENGTGTPPINVNEPLATGSALNIPRLAGPIASKNFLLQGQSNGTENGTQETPSNNPPGEGPSSNGQNGQQAEEPGTKSSPPGFSNKILFQLNSKFFPDTGAPAAPKLQIWAVRESWSNPCHPQISVYQGSENEDGYFIYRSGSDDPALKRIGALDKMDPRYGNQWYIDKEDISGVFTYVASAYNTAGESFSNPLVIDLSDCDYTPASSRHVSEESADGGISLQNGILTLPASVDLAYLFVGINGTFWERVPPGTDNFLQGSGYQFSLEKYLGGLVGRVDDPDLDITIEVWGWQGGQVGLIGTYHSKIHRAVLKICSQEGGNGCQGTWGREAFLSTEKPIEQQIFDLQLVSSSALKNEDMEFEVFTIDDLTPWNETHLSSWMFCDSDIGRCGDVTNLANGGTVQWPFAMARYYNSPTIGSKYDPIKYDLKKLYWYNRPFNVLLRVFPIDQQGNRGIASNTVILHYQTPPEQPEALPLASNLPSLYTVEILEDTYKVPIFLNEANWGCVTVLNDPFYDPTLVINQAGDSMSLGYPPGKACPPDRVREDSNWDIGGLFEGIAEMVSEGFNDLYAYVVQFEQGIVDGVAELIPGCADSDDCKGLLKKGLDVGITALTGVPPSALNFDQLATDGIAYTVNQVQSSLAGGYTWCEECTDTLTSQLKQAIHDARQLNSQPTCTTNEQVAWYYGKEPGWCLPPYVELAPYPGGSNQPGAIKVRVTRNSTPAPPGELRDQYFLDIATLGTNTQRKGTNGNGCKYVADGYQKPTDRVDPFFEYNHAFYEDQEQGELYNKVRISMPLLESGQSVEIPIPLQPTGRDNTKYSYMPDLDCNGFADFEYLFFKGTSQITASEYCLASNGAAVPCTGGSTDTFTTVNPMDPSEQWGP